MLVEKFSGEKKIKVYYISIYSNCLFNFNFTFKFQSIFIFDMTWNMRRMYKESNSFIFFHTFWSSKPNWWLPTFFHDKTYLCILIYIFSVASVRDYRDQNNVSPASNSNIYQPPNSVGHWSQNWPQISSETMDDEASVSPPHFRLVLIYIFNSI